MKVEVFRMDNRKIHSKYTLLKKDDRPDEEKSIIKIPFKINNAMKNTTSMFKTCLYL